MMSDITTPCHGAPLIVLTRQEKSGYYPEDIPNKILCDEPGCCNTWDAHGKADEWNRVADR